MRKLLAVVAAVAAALAFGSAAQAITGGQRDGSAHPSVAARCTDFLLHDLGITDVWVTFSSDSAQGPYIHGVMH